MTNHVHLLKQADEEYEKKTLAKAKGLDWDTLMKATAEFFDIDERTIKGSSKERTVSRARSIICHLGINKMGIKGIEIARKLKLSSSTVSKSAVRGQTDSISNKSKINYLANHCKINSVICY